MAIQKNKERIIMGDNLKIDNLLSVSAEEMAALPKELQALMPKPNLTDSVFQLLSTVNSVVSAEYICMKLYTDYGLKKRTKAIHTSAAGLVSNNRIIGIRLTGKLHYCMPEVYKNILENK